MTFTTHKAPPACKGIFSTKNCVTKTTHLLLLTLHP